VRSCVVSARESLTIIKRSHTILILDLLLLVCTHEGPARAVGYTPGHSVSERQAPFMADAPDSFPLYRDRFAWYLQLIRGAQHTSSVHIRPLYNVIVSSIIPSAGNPSKELWELGLNDSYLRYSGTNAYSPDSLLADSSAAATFSQMTSYRKLAIFYLRHPLRAAYVLHTGLNEAASQRPKLFGNFDKRTGYPPHARSNRFSLWSSLKQSLFEQHGWGYLIYSLAMLGIVARYSRDYAACLALLTLSALAIGGLADNIETTRHLFVFNALLDLTFVFAVAGTLNTTSI
jgi:hypothetical protein